MIYTKFKSNGAELMSPTKNVRISFKYNTLMLKIHKSVGIIIFDISFNADSSGDFTFYESTFFNVDVASFTLRKQYSSSSILNIFL